MRRKNTSIGFSDADVQRCILMEIDANVKNKYYIYGIIGIFIGKN